MSNLVEVSLPISTLRCQISGQIFRVPVLADDGYIYEEECISKWVKRNNISPITRATISDRFIYCYPISDMVTSFLDQHPEYRKEQYWPSLLSLLTRMSVNLDLLEQYRDCFNQRDKHGRTPLIIAIQKRDVKLAHKIIEIGQYDPDYTYGEFNRSELLSACTAQLPTVALALIKRKWFRKGFQDLHGSTAINLASEFGMKEVVAELIQEDPGSINLVDADGDTPLLCASWKKHEQIGLLLLESKKCNPGQINCKRFTPLLYACLGNMPKLAEALVKTKRSRPGQVAPSGDTALILAARYSMRGVIRALVALPDCKPDHIARSGYTALLEICLQKENFESEAIKLIQTRKSLPGHIGGRPSMEITALILACHRKWEKVAYGLLLTDDCNPGYEVPITTLHWLNRKFPPTTCASRVAQETTTLLDFFLPLGEAAQAPISPLISAPPSPIGPPLSPIQVPIYPLVGNVPPPSPLPLPQPVPFPPLQQHFIPNTPMPDSPMPEQLQMPLTPIPELQMPLGELPGVPFDGSLQQAISRTNYYGDNLQGVCAINFAYQQQMYEVVYRLQMMGGKYLYKCGVPCVYHRPQSIKREPETLSSDDILINKKKCRSPKIRQRSMSI